MSFYGTYFDSAGGAFAFWMIGYALAYGGDDVTMPRLFLGHPRHQLTLLVSILMLAWTTVE